MNMMIKLLPCKIKENKREQDYFVPAYWGVEKHRLGLLVSITLTPPSTVDYVLVVVLLHTVLVAHLSGSCAILDYLLDKNSISHGINACITYIQRSESQKRKFLVVDTEETVDDR